MLFAIQPSFSINRADGDDCAIVHQCEEMRFVLGNRDHIASFELDIEIAGLLVALNDEDTASGHNTADFIFRMRVDLLEFLQQFLNVRRCIR